MLKDPDNRILRKVFLDLQPQWEEEVFLLKEELKKTGVGCEPLTQKIWEKRDEWRKEAVVLTDSPERCTKFSQADVVCFGCSYPIEWFDGAALVLEGFEGIDAKYLEEWMLRAQGLPALIARTERLEIREMAERDLPEMIRIGNESRAVENLSVNADMFSEERLSSYIKTAYRLQGYGLWSVLHEGKLIGCCGFAPWNAATIAQADFAESVQLAAAKEGSVGSVQLAAAKEGSVGSVQLTAAKADSADSAQPTSAAAYMTFRLDLPVPKSEESQIITRPGKSALELQYMLDRAYQRQGFGTEMCQAVLEYAYERLDADEIYLRIRPDNQASGALAKKLHFIEQQDIG